MKEKVGDLGIAERYYVDGYLLREFAAGPSLERLNKVFGELADQGPRAPFHMQEKYAHSADLRPHVYSYDPVFLDILVENGIPALLRKVTGVELHLAHIQLRISYPGESYMDWHRDTLIYDDKVIGNAPPVHKIIFYPLSDGKSQLQLKVLPGSQLRMFKRRWVDLLQCRFLKAREVHSSTSQFLLFNTSIMHAVAAEKSKRGSFRIIYAFCGKDELAGFPDQGDLHRAYEEKLLLSRAAADGG